MIRATRPERKGGGVLTITFLAGTTVFLGLLSGFPLFFGPVVALVGIGLSVTLYRLRRSVTHEVASAPTVIAIGLLAIAAPVAPSTELFAGLSAIALLFWMADDPWRPASGPRRASRAVMLAALAFALAWGTSLLLPTGRPEIGIAGGLIAFGIVLLALLFGRPEWIGRGSTETA